MKSLTPRNALLFFFSHRLLAIARWDVHFLAVRLKNALTGQTGRIRAFLGPREKPVYLNLGAGPRGLDDRHWVNVDGFSDTGVHFLMDFGRDLPFPDATFDGVFSEHVFEHFTQEDGGRLAREVYRVLRHGGCFRIVVPDAELVLRRYFDAPEKIVAWRGEGTETPMEIVNSFFRQRYEHQFLYDWTTMKAMLERAGFELVVRAAFGQSTCCADIALDHAKYEWESLYVEAVKQSPARP